MASQEDVDELKQQLQKLRVDHDSLQRSARSQVGASAPIYVATRKLDRFKDRPEKFEDPTVEDWVADARNHLLARNLTGQAAVACVKEHLSGKARLEILGRGSDDDPEKIFATLLRVFGDGDQLPQLQQKFYSYSQKEGEDLITCSLKLLQLFDRIVQLDSTFESNKTSLLKGRLAEAVRDEGLRRELRRLNAEHKDISFFEARDRALAWLGGDVSGISKPKAKASINETRTASKESAFEEVLRKQGEMLEKQQKNIEAILARMESGSTSARGTGRRQNQRRCWTCEIGRAHV